MTGLTKEFELLRQRFERDAKLFDDIYSNKNRGFNTWFNRRFRKPIFERFEIALNALGNVRDKKVIDIGCGSGVYVVTLALKGANKVVGVDFSNSMIEIAAQNIKDLKLENVCELKCINFLETTNMEKFNFSLAMGVFDYLSDPITFLHKLKSVTTEKVVASFPGHSLIREPLRKLRYLLTSRGKVYFYSKADIQRIVAAVGFSDYELIPGVTGSGFVLVARP